MAEDKEHHEIMQEVSQLGEQLTRVFVTSIAIAGSTSRSTAAVELLSIASKVFHEKIKVKSFDHMDAALREASSSSDVVLVTGSLHGAAEAAHFFA